MKIKLLLFALLIQGSALWAQLPRFNHGLVEWTEGWQTYPGWASDVDVAPDGRFWHIGSDSGIYLWNDSTATWDKMPGAATKVACGPVDTWVRNSAGSIYRFDWDLYRWAQIPGWASEIACGADGSFWRIGSDKNLYQYNEETGGWNFLDAPDAIKIAVDPDGNPWIIKSTGQPAYWDGAYWIDLPGCLKEIAIGFDGATWGLGCDSGTGGWSVFRWSEYQWRWNRQDGRLTSIAVLPNGGAAGSNSNGTILYRNCNTIAGDYYIESVHSGHMLDASLNTYGRVHLWPFHGRDNQIWRVRKLAEDGSYSLRNISTGRVLDVEYGDLENGGVIGNYDWHGGLNQRFSIDEYDPVNNYGEYVITGVNSGLVMQVENASLNSNVVPVQWEYTGDTHQRWLFYLYGTGQALGSSKSVAINTITSGSEAKSNGNPARISIHPNPVQEQFTLDIEAVDAQNTKLSVSDLTGKVVLQRDLELVKGANQVQVDLERSLPNGMYTVQIAGFKAERIIVQH